MKKPAIKKRVLEILGEIAPESDLESIDPAVSFRDQIDIDSMDYLNFVIALDDEFSVAIPESSYTKLTTINSCVEQIESLQNGLD